MKFMSAFVVLAILASFLAAVVSENNSATFATDQKETEKRDIFPGFGHGLIPGYGPAHGLGCIGGYGDFYGTGHEVFGRYGRGHGILPPGNGYRLRNHVHPSPYNGGCRIFP